MFRNFWVWLPINLNYYNWVRCHKYHRILKHFRMIPGRHLKNEFSRWSLQEPRNTTRIGTKRDSSHWNSCRLLGAVMLRNTNLQPTQYMMSINLIGMINPSQLFIILLTSLNNSTSWQIGLIRYIRRRLIYINMRNLGLVWMNSRNIWECLRA